MIVTGVYLADVDEAFHGALAKQITLIAVILIALLIAIRLAAQRMIFAPMRPAVQPSVKPTARAVAPRKKAAELAVETESSDWERF